MFHRLGGRRLVLIVSALGLCACAGCGDLLAALFPSFGAGPPGTAFVRLRVRNESGVTANLEATFHARDNLTRETSRVLPPEGPTSEIEIIWTIADTVRAVARVAAEPAAQPGAQLKPGDVLAERTYRLGTDFNDGDILVFVIPAPGAGVEFPLDCNANANPDANDITTGASADENANGFPDECETPVADAGPDQTATDLDGDGVETFTLDGSGSTTPYGTITGHVWREGATEIASGAGPGVTLPVGVHTVTLEVSGSTDLSDTDEVVLTVLPQPPQALGLVLDSPLVGIGRMIDGHVQLVLPAPAGGLEVTLTSLDPEIATIFPGMVTIPEGQTSALFTVTGVSIGVATLKAEAADLDPATVDVEVTGTLISLAQGLEVAPGQSTGLAVSLTEPAPTGGVTITLVSSDPNTATITPSVFIAEGAQIPAANPQVTGVAIGTVEITASAPGFAPDTQDVTVTVHLSFEPTSVNVVTGNTVDLRLRLSAPVAGLVLNLSTDQGSVAVVPPTVVTGACETCAIVTVTAAGPGATTLRASAPGIAEATAGINVVGTPNIILGNASVGMDLQTTLSSFNRRLGFAAPAGGVIVTLVSSDPNAVVLSDDPLEMGSAMLDLEVPAGSTQIPPFHIQALADAGTVAVAAAAPGYAAGGFNVTLTPSGFRISSPGNFTTTTLADATFISLVSSRLTPGTLTVAQDQPLRGGVGSVPVNLTNSDGKVGQLSSRFVTFGPNEGFTFVEFQPAGVGMTDIAVVTPGGFQTPATGQQITATVTLPDIFLSDQAAERTSSSCPIRSSDSWGTPPRRAA